MSENETVADVLKEWRDMVCYHTGPVHPLNHGAVMLNLDRIEAAWKREREEIVDAVSVLRDGMCPHCDLQQQCAEGEDGMPTTCNAMAKVNNFVNRFKKIEVSDECPF